MTGAAHTWNQNTGVLVLSNPTADGTVTVTAEQIKIAAPTLSISGSTLSIVTSDNLPSTYTLTATGVGDTKTKSGLLKSGTTTTFDLSTWLTDIGTYTITAVVVNSIYATSDSSNAVTYTVVQPQLATPQNVTAEGTTVSWDAVENAESYDVYADDTVLLGNTTGRAVSSHTLTFETAEATVNGNTVTSPYTLQNGDTIVLVYAAGTITVNGTTYSETQTISLSNVDIVVTAKRQSPLSTTLTINYTE